MEYKIFSEEWATAFSNYINSNEQYKIASKGWQWSVVLYIKDSDPHIGVLLDLFEGICREAKALNGGSISEADYILCADKETWQKLLNENTDPMGMIMRKKLLLEKGNISNLLKYINASKEMLNAAKNIPTSFEY